MKKIKIIKKFLENLIDEYTIPLIDISLQRTCDIKEDVENLEKRIKRIEKEIKWHWRVLNILLFISIIAFLYSMIH